jgi:hypothetical protein
MGKALRPALVATLAVCGMCCLLAASCTGDGCLSQIDGDASGGGETCPPGEQRTRARGRTADQLRPQQPGGVPEGSLSSAAATRASVASKMLVWPASIFCQ